MDPAVREPIRGGRCPRCLGELESMRSGHAAADARNCLQCAGIFITHEALTEYVKRAKADNVTHLGIEGEPPRDAGGKKAGSARGYAPCPDCGELMNRTGFAPRSGVLVDICIPHGIWFDGAELERALRFLAEHPNISSAATHGAFSAFRAHRDKEPETRGQDELRANDRFAELRATALRYGLGETLLDLLFRGI
jgi:Zn-finger nucleic acid-binding protein